MDATLKRGVLVFFFGMLGLILAGIEGLMNTNGTLINEFITGTVTIEALQIVTILVALLFGVVFAVYTQG